MTAGLLRLLAIFCFISGASGLMIVYEVLHEGLKVIDRAMLLYFSLSQIPFFIGIFAILRDLMAAKEAEMMDKLDESIDPAAQLEHQSAYRAIGKLLFFLFCYFFGFTLVYIIK